MGFYCDVGGDEILDWIVGLQEALNYIEEHIGEAIDYNHLAMFVSYSPQYFQKIFSMICGISVGEYIRRRKMTLAGNDILFTDKKIIEIASDYGYDNPNNFTRSFTAFHGVSPTEARETHALLKTYSPLHLKIAVEGGSCVNYKMVEKEGFYVLGKIETQPIVEKAEYVSVIEFWKKMYKSGEVDNLIGLSLDKSNIYGIGFDDQLNCDRDVDYMIGSICDKDCSPLDGYCKILIPKRTWMVIPCVGKLPDSIYNLWNTILTDVLPTSIYKPTGEYEIEKYSMTDSQNDDYYCELWLTVEKR